jgi:hypothetical protein
VENARFVYHLLRTASLRGVFWHFAQRRARRARLKRPEFASFLRQVRAEPERVRAALAGDRPPDDEIRLAAAVAWVLRAQQATSDAGVSLGYFPLNDPAGWYPSYPETSGYLITTLLQYAAQYRRDDVRDAALAMAHWEAEIQMPNGAVQGGPLTAAEYRTPAAFNTGMVLDGWCTAYEVSRERQFLDAGTAAARFLASDIDEDGCFRTNGKFVSQGETKTYNCLCGWAMLRFARLTEDPQLENAALRVVEAVLRRQHKNGWFSNNCLELSSIPLTHTIGYTLQGVVEVGALAGRSDFIAAAQLGLENLLIKQQPDGFLPGRFDAHWKPAANFVCLTGSCQLALVAYRLVELAGRRELLALADRLMAFVKATQLLDSEDPNVIGAIAGSYPILGDYQSANYPNWATKFFIDALLVRRRL